MHIFNMSVTAVQNINLNERDCYNIEKTLFATSIMFPKILRKNCQDIIIYCDIHVHILNNAAVKCH